MDYNGDELDYLDDNRKFDYLDDFRNKIFQNLLQLYYFLDFSIETDNISDYRLWDTSLNFTESVVFLLEKEEYYNNDNFKSVFRNAFYFHEYFDYFCDNIDKFSFKVLNFLLSLFDLNKGTFVKNNDEGSTGYYQFYRDGSYFIQKWMDIERYPEWYEILVKLYSTFEFQFI